MSPRTLRNPRTLRRMMMVSSIVVAVLLTAVLVGGLPGIPPDAPGRMVFVVSLAIITGVLAGLFWYWFFGSWFREYFRLDREYRPIDGNGHVNLDTTEELFRSLPRGQFAAPPFKRDLPCSSGRPLCAGDLQLGLGMPRTSFISWLVVFHNHRLRGCRGADRKEHD